MGRRGTPSQRLQATRQNEVVRLRRGVLHQLDGAVERHPVDRHCRAGHLARFSQAQAREASGV